MASDERHLVRRAKRGDEEAFKTLMQKYQRKVYAIAYGMVRNPEAAMDISQEVFIKVYRYLGSFQGTSSFYTWLYRISVNLSIDYIRKQSRHDMKSYDDMTLRHESDGIEAQVAPTRSDENPQINLDRKELRGKISKAFEMLSEKHRAVLLLREVEGLSYDELAKTLKINKGTVMSRLHHARKQIQEVMEGYLKDKNAATSDSYNIQKTYESKGQSHERGA